MSSSSEELESFASPTDPIDPIEPNQPKSKVKKCIQTTFAAMVITAFVCLIITINVYKPAKEELFNIGNTIIDLGWRGYLILVLFNGCIVIPLALPYMIFEITMAMLIPNYWMAWVLSLSSKFVGCSVCYYITKHHIRDRILKKLKNSNFYRGMETILKRNPFQFSVIIRVIYIPVFLKNYCLAVPEFMNFKTYVLAAIFDFLPESTILIYIFQKVENLHSIFDQKHGPLQTFIEVFMGILSVSAIVYVVYKTRQVLRSIREEADHLKEKLISDTMIEDDRSTESSESKKDEYFVPEVVINSDK